MFEKPLETIISVCIYLVSSLAGCVYTDRCLKAGISRRAALLAWFFLYFAGESLILERIPNTGPLYNLLRIFADMGIIVLLQFLLYQKEPLKQLFVTVSFVAGKEIIKYIIVGLNYAQYQMSDTIFAAVSGVVNTMKKAGIWLFVSNGMIWFLTLFLYALLMLVYFSAISSSFRKKEYFFSVWEYASLLLPHIATLCISITLKILLVTIENGMTTVIFYKVPAVMFWVPLICFLLLGLNISSCTLCQKLVQAGQEERKRTILENQMLQMQKEIREIQDIYGDMRGLRHDMKNQLESIAAIASRTGGAVGEEIHSYIGKMEETVDRLDFPYATGNPITDMIVHRKKQEAEKQLIIFQADFACPLRQQIDVYDIGIILNNALENAIEAASRVTGEKEILLRTYKKGSLFFVEIENDFSGTIVIDSKTGLPVTNKADKKLHGLGMENIQKCARKYKGDIDITLRETANRKKFILTVMMYEKSFTPENS